MIYVTGDTHANFHRFNSHYFPEQKHMEKSDTMIILGDFGGVWNQVATNDEDYWLDWLNDKPFTTLYVDGNHENFDRYYDGEFEVVDYCGGKADKIRDNIYHLQRGNVFNIEGLKFFAFGGASSHDIDDGILDVRDFKSHDEFKEKYNKMLAERKMFRVNHLSWWEQELPSQEEMNFGIKTLEENNWEVDYVISHCMPQEIVTMMYGAWSNGFENWDKLTLYFQKLIQDGLKFTKWFSGHYHLNHKYLGKFEVLYENIIRIN